MSVHYPLPHDRITAFLLRNSWFIMGLSESYLDSPEDLGILRIAFCPREIMLFQWCAFALQGNDWVFIQCPVHFGIPEFCEKKEKNKKTAQSRFSTDFGSGLSVLPRLWPWKNHHYYDHHLHSTSTSRMWWGPAHPTIFDAFSVLWFLQ